MADGDPRGTRPSSLPRRAFLAGLGLAAGLAFGLFERDARAADVEGALRPKAFIISAPTA